MEEEFKLNHKKRNVEQIEKPFMSQKKLKEIENMSDSISCSTQNTTKNIPNKVGIENMILKNDHQNRPIWVSPDCHIFLETFSPLYRYAYEFLIAIAEPISRPAFIHEYELTQYSLYAAMVLQMTPKSIKDYLQKLSKNEIPKEVDEFITINTKQYGSARINLDKNKYMLEIFDPNLFKKNFPDGKILQMLKKVETDQSSKMLIENPIMQSLDMYANEILKEKNIEKIVEQMENLVDNLELSNEKQLLTKKSEIYEITDHHTKITKQFIEKNIPLIEDYDFINDTQTPSLQIELKPNVKIRDYQERALSKVFIGQKARSGVIVLPCGAGKTLVGIIATTMVKKSTIVFCNNNLAVNQWINQFKLFTDITDDRIIKVQSKVDETEKFNRIKNDAFIVVTNYQLISGRKSQESNFEPTIKRRQMIQEMKNHEWGLILLDEVQVFPAEMFQTVLLQMKAHFKLGIII